MDAPRILPVLVRELERRGASVAQIADYGSYWKKIQPNEKVPCPNCYVFHREHGLLVALPQTRGVRPMKCRRCKEVFEMPIP
jgi:hypothetical protein